MTDLSQMGICVPQKVKEQSKKIKSEKKIKVCEQRIRSIQGRG